MERGWDAVIRFIWVQYIEKFGSGNNALSIAVSVGFVFFIGDIQWLGFVTL